MGVLKGVTVGRWVLVLDTDETGENVVVSDDGASLDIDSML